MTEKKKVMTYYYNLENIMLSEVSQIWKAAYYINPLILSVQNRQIYKKRGGC